jgi:hypothetical protein
MTPAVKKTVTALLLLFFLLFPHYSVYLGHSGSMQSWSEIFFQLTSFMANQTLGIVHEAGHGVCYLLPCPHILTAAMGTVFQWLFPAGVAWYFWHRGERFGAMVALFFLGFSMQYTAWYMSTAQEGRFVTASHSFLGVDGYHDFYEIFSYFGLLRYDGLIAGLTRFAAYAVMVVSLIGMVLEAFIEEKGK